MSEAEQAAFLAEGFQCLANDTYVVADLNVPAPTEGQRFVDSSISRFRRATPGRAGPVSYACDGGKETRNFTDALTNGATFALSLAGSPRARRPGGDDPVIRPAP